jgi:hypothetical protein
MATRTGKADQQNNISALFKSPFQKMSPPM